MTVKSGRIRALAMVSALAALCLWASLANASSYWMGGYLAPYGPYGQAFLSDTNWSLINHVFQFDAVHFKNSCDGVNPPNWGGAALVNFLHTNGVKVTFTVGGDGMDTCYSSMTSNSTKLARFVDSVANITTQYGYDGMDIDWESGESGAGLLALVQALRAKYESISPNRYLIVVYTTDDGRSDITNTFAPLAPYIDMFNVNSYSYSGPWLGWQTWYDGPLYNGGQDFKSTGGPLPSINYSISRYLRSGVPASKLSVGSLFYEETWTGGSNACIVSNVNSALNDILTVLTGNSQCTASVAIPQESWSTNPSKSGPQAFYTMYGKYNSSSTWDPVDQNEFVSVIDNSNSLKDKFISYEGQRTVAAKISYMKSMGLGGFYAFDLAEEFISGGGTWSARNPMFSTMQSSLSSSGSSTSTTTSTTSTSTTTSASSTTTSSTATTQSTTSTETTTVNQTTAPTTTTIVPTTTVSSGGGEGGGGGGGGSAVSIRPTLTKTNSSCTMTNVSKGSTITCVLNGITFVIGQNFVYINQSGTSVNTKGYTLTMQRNATSLRNDSNYTYYLKLLDINYYNYKVGAPTVDLELYSHGSNYANGTGGNASTSLTTVASTTTARTTIASIIPTTTASQSQHGQQQEQSESNAAAQQAELNLAIAAGAVVAAVCGAIAYVLHRKGWRPRRPLVQASSIVEHE